MVDTNIFAIASVHADWLAARQSALAGNIANANVPGYRSIDTVSFDNYLQVASKSAGAGSRSAPTAEAKPFVELGSDVAVEKELHRAAEVRSAHSLNTAITASFHSLFLAAARAQ